ncbi:unnamed protein product [Mytilus coruscus]|uniref:EF-hand domain-containing protein n=1 Tax=Mytilus coruscus TaxID=42192 RepID=A0A6J8B3Y8_MYTCO|nr:unnamed protein product [Mytilus coruscus]
MAKNVHPISPPEYSGPGPSFDGGPNPGIYPGAVEIMTPDRIADTILQQIIWLGALAYAISYIVFEAAKVFQFHNVSKNQTMKCDQEFYNFYHDAKIGQMVVLIPYTLYVIVSMFIVIPKAKNWFMRHKWRQWASLLDADQDGIISSDDMERTNTRLEQLRLAIGDRKTTLNAEVQKNGGMIIYSKEEPTNTSLLTTMSIIWREFIIPQIWGTKCAQLSPAFLNFFSTPDFWKMNCILAEEDFIKFWAILKIVDEVHCRNVYIRHFLNPSTMESFLGDFVAIVSYNDFFDENTIRVHTVLKLPRSATCDSICHPSCCGV